MLDMHGKVAHAALAGMRLHYMVYNPIPLGILIMRLSTGTVSCSTCST